MFSELGISRAPVACMAYLMKKNKWTLQVHICIAISMMCVYSIVVYHLMTKDDAHVHITTHGAHIS